MDNEKIGKFITKLRKAKNLTQQQLGDLVGVGGKSVSKWERGLNMPDISIINQVSKVLGITSDELLKGEFSKNSINEEYRKKRNQRRYRLFLVLLLILTVAITTLLVFKFRNVTHKYWITSKDENFSVLGYIECDKNGYSLNISKIYCDMKECKEQYIDNIQYSILINNFVLYMNSNSEQSNNKVILNDYLHDKVININDEYRNSVISFRDIEQGKSIFMVIDGYYNDTKQFSYKINLETTDKKG